MLAPRQAAFALLVLALPAVSARAQTPVPRATIARAVDSLADETLRGGKAPALSIAVVRGGDTIVMKGYGMADLENDVPATAQTVYRIGSVTKQFTSAAVMQLVEQGKIGLDDEITKYIPGFPTRGRRILVRHLLNHTSGIASYTDVGPAFATRATLSLPHDSLLAIVRDDSLLFEPGTHFYYNNTGYYMLGMILERVAGKPYGDYLHDRLFAPLGLSSTVYCGTAPIVKRRAHGYQRTATGFVNADYLNMDIPFAAGSLCSTVGDLSTWARALASSRVVSATSYAQMTTPVTLPSGRPMTYGFGLGSRTLGTHRVIEHGGGINGFISQLSLYPDDSLVVAVLANSSPAPSSELAEDIARVALGMPPRRAPESAKKVATTAEERVRYTGTYRVTWPDGSRRTARVVETGEQLALEIDGQPRVPLAQQDTPHTFAGPGGRVVFDVEGGRVTGFYLDRGARPLEGTRVP